MPGIQRSLQILTIKIQLHNDSHLYFDLSGYNLVIKSKYKKDFVRQWANLSQFYRLSFRQAVASMYWSKVTSTSLKNIFDEHWLQFFCTLNSPKNFTCPLGKIRTEFTSLIAKSTGTRLTDTTFFPSWSDIPQWPTVVCSSISLLIYLML